MMWYTPIECDNAVTRPMVVEHHDLHGVEPEDLRVGQPIGAWTDTASLRVIRQEADGEPDDVLQNHVGSLPIFSPRLHRALEYAGVSDMQYLPVRLIHHDGRVVDGHTIANILTLASIDRDRSVYSVFPDNFPIERKRGQLRELRRPALKASELRGHDIVRIAEYPLYICVSQRFKDVFEAGGFTGYNFAALGMTESGQLE